MLLKIKNIKICHFFRAVLKKSKIATKNGYQPSLFSSNFFQKFWHFSESITLSILNFLMVSYNFDLCVGYKSLFDNFYSLLILMEPNYSRFTHENTPYSPYKYFKRIDKVFQHFLTSLASS
jgi:hypothetical protein